MVSWLDLGPPSIQTQLQFLVNRMSNMEEMFKELCSHHTVDPTLQQETQATARDTSPLPQQPRVSPMATPTPQTMRSLMDLNPPTPQGYHQRPRSRASKKPNSNKQKLHRDFTGPFRQDGAPQQNAPQNKPTPPGYHKWLPPQLPALLGLTGRTLPVPV